MEIKKEKTRHAFFLLPFSFGRRGDPAAAKGRGEREKKKTPKRSTKKVSVNVVFASPRCAKHVCLVHQRVEGNEGAKSTHSTAQHTRSQTATLTVLERVGTPPPKKNSPRQHVITTHKQPARWQPLSARKLKTLSNKGGHRPERKRRWECGNDAKPAGDISRGNKPRRSYEQVARRKGRKCRCQNLAFSRVMTRTFSSFWFCDDSSSGRTVAAFERRPGERVASSEGDPGIACTVARLLE